jgi:hypothetical protein
MKILKADIEMHQIPQVAKMKGIKIHINAESVTTPEDFKMLHEIITKAEACFNKQTQR